MIWYCDAQQLGKIHWFGSPEVAAEAFARSTAPTPSRSPSRLRPALQDETGDQARP